jgi:DNA helicase-2/ATP-dependent DNA helicase PcrA
MGNLNERQKEAAQHKDGPLLIIAGAGAGKTKTIAHRIVNLINNGVTPCQILAVTFTNKAAKEMADRVRLLLPLGSNSAGLPVMCTFHSLGVRILKENAETIGRSKYFSILDSDESLSFMKRSAKDLGLDPKEINMKAISNIISSNKNKMIGIADYEQNAPAGYFKNIVVKVWGKYEELLKENEAYDFDDLILKTVQLLANKKEILNYYQTLWRYIHIDEYQDTNTSQYELSRLLAEKHGNICVVGDSDQSIYGWRCADFRNILNFEHNFPGAKTVLLEQNYRSTQNILDFANRVIRKNKLRKEKNLFTVNKQGEKITIFEALDENDEANFVVQKAKDIIKKGVRPSDVAVLYRANFQSRALEEHFIRAGVPYQVLGTRFYERKEIKDIIAFIKFALNPKDNLSLARIINVPPRGIGKITLEKIISGRMAELPQSTKDKLAEFNKKIERIKNHLLTNKLPESIKYIVKEIGLDTSLKEEGKEEGMERLENIRELANITTKYNSLSNEEAIHKFIEDTSLMSDQDAIMDRQARDGVRLMTVHSSKGLEFKDVFVTGLEQDLFPHKGWGDMDDSDPEEERRLFYVAVTRAKEKLFISYAASRMIFGQRQLKTPSEFLEDIDEEIADVEKNENAYYGERGVGGGWQKKEDDIIWDCLN